MLNQGLQQFGCPISMQFWIYFSSIYFLDLQQLLKNNKKKIIISFISFITAITYNQGKNYYLCNWPIIKTSSPSFVKKKKRKEVSSPILLLVSFLFLSTCKKNWIKKNIRKMIIHKDVKLLCCFKKIYSNFLDFFFA
jgi:hypothetical protein